MQFTIGMWECPQRASLQHAQLWIPHKRIAPNLTIIHSFLKVEQCLCTAQGWQINAELCKGEARQYLTGTILGESIQANETPPHLGCWHL